MRFEDLNGLRAYATSVSENTSESDKEAYGNLLMEVFNFLGYTESSVLSGGAYNMASEQTFQFAIRTDDDNSSDRVYFKIVEVGVDLSGFEQDIRETIVAHQGVVGLTKYYVITNGIIYKIYQNTPSETELIRIEDVGTVNLTVPAKDDAKIFSIISMQGLKGEPQNFDIDDINLDEPEEEPEEEPKEEAKQKKEIKLPTIDEKTIDLIKKISLVVLAIIILLLVFKFLTAKPDSEKTSETNINIDVNKNDDTKNKTNTNSSLITIDSNLENISAVLDLSVSKNDTLSIKFISDLEEGAIVKLGIFCGDNSNYSYQKIDSTGTFNGTFQIPATWGEQKVTVGAYLRFDESGYSQPENVKKRYGSNGEKINWNKDYSANMITYSEINHSNQLVEALLKKQAEERELQLKNAFEKDFAYIDTRVDAFGNIKHVPAGFSFDETNITESRNIYPMIYYDKASNTSYFYIICGYAGTQFVRFESVGFACDGYNWSYDNGTNVKKDTVVGNKKAEWIYFNNVDTPQLLNDMGLVAASKDTQLYLVGAISPSFNITAEDKASIAQFLAIYETYYGNGTFVPDVSLFKESTQNITLNYIKEPIEMRERSSAELNSLILLQNSMSQKKLNNEEISKDDEELLEMMKKTFRPISKTMKGKIYSSVVNSEPTALYYDDYETGKKFFKIYFVYSATGEIEDGYIPYINVYEDRTVIIPIKTITAKTTSADKVFAQYQITDTFYNELKTYFANTNYEQFN